MCSIPSAESLAIISFSQNKRIGWEKTSDLSSWNIYTSSSSYLSINSLDERTQRLWPVAVRTDSVMLQHECLLCLSLACCAVETNHVVSVHKTEELTWMVVHNLIWFIYDNEVFIIRYESQVLVVHHTLLARCPPQWLEELRVTHSQIVIWNNDANFPHRSLQYC